MKTTKQSPLTLYVVTTSTPVGDFHLLIERMQDAKKKIIDVVRVSGFGPLVNLKKRLPIYLQIASFETRAHHPYQSSIRAYFKGDPHALSLIHVMQEGTVLAERVWKAMASIPYGQTVSYQEIARQAGSPKAVRAIGTWCGRNLLPVLIPCHRVVRSDGTQGGYLYGSRIKSYLLQLERGK